MTNKISILQKEIFFNRLFIVFLWVVIVLVGVVECGHLRAKQKEIENSMTMLEMNLATHRHEGFNAGEWERKIMFHIYKNKQRNVEIYNPNK